MMIQTKPNSSSPKAKRHQNIWNAQRKKDADTEGFFPPCLLTSLMPKNCIPSVRPQ